jgi:hypothetical protein
MTTYLIGIKDDGNAYPDRTICSYISTFSFYDSSSISRTLKGAQSNE